MKLYEISEDYFNALEAYQRAENDEEQAAALELVSKVDKNLDEKVIACLSWLRNLESDVDAIDYEIKRLQAKKLSAASKVQHFRDYIKNCIEPLGKWSNGVFSVHFRESQSVIVENEQLLENCYKKEVWELVPDKEEIKKALKTGAVVTGARLENKKVMVIK